MAASLGVGARQQDARQGRRAGRPRQSAARRAWRESIRRATARRARTRSAMCAAFDDALRREDAERDRQIERRAGLADVGRRQVDGDAVRRKLEAGVADRAAHAIAALAHAGVGQADHRERRQAERHVHLHMDRAGFDAEERRRSAGRRARAATLQTQPARGAVSMVFERAVASRICPASRCADVAQGSVRAGRVA